MKWHVDRIGGLRRVALLLVAALLLVLGMECEAIRELLRGVEPALGLRLFGW